MLKIGEEVKQVLKKEILEDIGWKSISWSGNDTGGIITTGMNMFGKLVSLRFVSTINSAHYCHTTFYWVANNNYLITNMNNATQYVVCNVTTSTGFNLIIPTTIKLDEIYYLNI